MADSFEIVEQQNVTNPTALAATAQEVVITGTRNVPYYNHLEVYNGDAVKIRVRLDNDTSRIYDVESKVAMVMDVSEGQQFNQVVQVNQDAATAEVAGTIIFKAMHKRRL